jgi:hypothetical protein
MKLTKRTIIAAAAALAAFSQGCLSAGSPAKGISVASRRCPILSLMLEQNTGPTPPSRFDGLVNFEVDPQAASSTRVALAGASTRTKTKDHRVTLKRSRGTTGPRSPPDVPLLCRLHRADQQVPRSISSRRSSRASRPRRADGGDRVRQADSASEPTQCSPRFPPPTGARRWRSTCARATAT